MPRIPEHQRSHWRNAAQLGPPFEEIGAELNVLLRRALGATGGGILALVRNSQGRGDELVEVDGELKLAREHVLERPELAILANGRNALWQ